MAEVPAVEAAAVNEANIDNKEEPTDIAQATPARARWPQLHLRPRHRRHAMLAASVVIAASVGVLAGAALTGGFSKPASVDVIGLEESKTAQQSIARLSKDVASLKASLEAANKTAHSQIRQDQRASGARQRGNHRCDHAAANGAADIAGRSTVASGTSGIRSGIRRVVHRSSPTGRSAKRATAMSTCKVMATFIRSCRARLCRASGRSSRSSGRTVAGSWSRRRASSSRCATAAISSSSRPLNANDVQRRLRAPLFICA